MSRRWGLSLQFETQLRRGLLALFLRFPYGGIPAGIAGGVIKREDSSLVPYLLHQVRQDLSVAYFCITWSSAKRGSLIFKPLWWFR